MAKTLIISSMKWSGLPPHNVKRNKTSNVESHLVLLALSIWAFEFIRSARRLGRGLDGLVSR